MKINITKKQYWHLMRAMYMANWMVNAICEGDMKQDTDIEELENHIHSYAKDFGYGEFVQFSERFGRYFSTADFDDEPSIRGFIERYDEYVMWDELIEMLASRDLRKKYSREEIEKMSPEEFFEAEWSCREKWGKEFEKHGIKRITLNTDK